MPTESSPIHATLRYLVNSPRYATEQPYRLIEVPPTPEVPLTNMEFETHSDVPITNIREAQGSLSIEDNAFQLYEIPSSISIDATYGEVESYCKSMADFIQAELGALRVFIFEFRVRSYPFQLRKDNRFISGSQSSAPMRNRSFLCQHRKLGPCRRKAHPPRRSQQSQYGLHILVCNCSLSLLLHVLALPYVGLLISNQIKHIRADQSVYAGT